MTPLRASLESKAIFDEWVHCCLIAVWVCNSMSVMSGAELCKGLTMLKVEASLQGSRGSLLLFSLSRGAGPWNLLRCSPCSTCNETRREQQQIEVRV